MRKLLLKLILKIKLLQIYIKIFKTKLIKGQKITLVGRVTQYNGNLEIILEESKNLHTS